MSSRAPEPTGPGRVHAALLAHLGRPSIVAVYSDIYDWDGFPRAPATRSWWPGR
jgi:hypothetical protein